LRVSSGSQWYFVDNIPRGVGGDEQAFKKEDVRSARAISGDGVPIGFGAGSGRDETIITPGRPGTVWTTGKPWRDFVRRCGSCEKSVTESEADPWIGNGGRTTNGPQGWALDQCQSGLARRMRIGDGLIASSVWTKLDVDPDGISWIRLLDETLLRRETW